MIVTVKANQVGLVFKNGDLIKILDKGIYFSLFNKNVEIEDKSEQFYTNSSQWEILKRNPIFLKRVEIIEVSDNELVIEYRDNRFYRLLDSGRYIFWKDTLDLKFERFDMNTIEVPNSISKSLLKNSEFKEYVSELAVLPGQKAVLYVDGEYQRILDNGTYYLWKNGQSILINTVDLRQQNIEISGQELLTADKAMVRINFEASYKVVDIQKALIENKDYEKSLYSILQLAIRKYIGKFSLDQLLESKEEISESITQDSSSVLADLGVNLVSAGIKDIILPGEIREIMNHVLVAQKKAQANVITRREETASTRSLLNTAKLMEENEILFRLKEMEYVEKIAESIGEISLTGNGNMLEQLRDIFTSKNK